MAKTWKLAFLAVAAGLGLLLIGVGARPQTVSADPTSVVASSFDSGDTGLVRARFDQDDTGTLTELRVRVVATVATADLPNISNLTLSFLDCGTGASFATACAGSSTDSDPSANEFQWEGTLVEAIDANDTDEPWQLRLDITAECTADVTITVTATQNGVSSPDTLICTALATPTPTGTPPTATPTVTTTPGTVGSVVVAATPTSLGCGAISNIAITVKDTAGQNVANGTVVTVTASAGLIAPTTTSTSAGQALVIFAAPTTGGGTATITATASGVSGTATITLTCGAAPVPTTAPAPTQPPPQIRVPQTGDAGLAGTGLGWVSYAGIGLVLASLVGALSVVRRRA